MHKKTLLFCLLASAITSLSAQDITENKTDTDTIPAPIIRDEKAAALPVISYAINDNKKYAIADIQVTGVDTAVYADYILIGISGLTTGQKISVPGNEITSAINNFWKHDLFADANIYATKLTNDSVWLALALKLSPIISAIEYHGVKKGEREDLESKIGVAKGSQITPNLVNRIKKRTKDYFDEKGFSNADISIRQYDDLANKDKAILNITVDKKEKTKIRKIIIEGNGNISEFDLKMAMKKTNEGFSLRKMPMLNIRKLFSTKKFVKEEYQNDLENLINKYNEKGYRDARIISDSVAQVDDKHVAIHIKVEEGEKYFLRNIKWVGNTLYQSSALEFVLNMKPGDVYNQKKLGERLQSDDDAVANAYYNNGYIFAQLDPVETYLEKDSVDIEIRIFEGVQATINRILINGNDRLYEDIIRRELLTKPGQLFSKEVLMSTLREISQMGHFDPEHMDIKTPQNPEAGTVDIEYNLTSKANDQIEFSAGWGQTGLIGRVSVKFSNFSFNNLIHPDTYKGIIPQGEGQTLTLSGQTNGRYYQSYSISFLEPWLGGKRPNSFTLGAYYMSTSGMENSYYQSYNYYDPYYSITYDENKSMKIVGVSAGYGKRLSWPDYLFNLMGELSFQRYILQNWSGYFPIANGNANSLSLGITLSRNSTSSPIYPRSGSDFVASLSLTPPYSMFDNKDYSAMDSQDPRKYEWIEFHKWKFKGKIYIPLANPEKVVKTPVLMSRVEYGFLGAYNANKRTPFETFYVGGDGMTGYSSYFATETIGLRGYENGSLTPSGQEAYAYSRLALELRYPLMLEPTSTIYGLLFLEAGNAWNNISTFNPFALKRSAGVGARIFLPMIGLMGIDWGYGFDSPTNGATRSGGQFHFILGQEF
ncbi:MAG: outer membrane protein assembly factor BamA [Dysgonamonadaceae bacterium]|jgi:outer membrane protein insertion porin family|nr:outer membrane protein assembly factor BamA [Dysgonamonadaceae bacterium]